MSTDTEPDAVEPWLKARPEGESNATRARALTRIAGIIEAVDRRRSGFGGSGGPTAQEMTKEEVSEIYGLATGKSVRPTLQELHAIHEDLHAPYPFLVEALAPAEPVGADTSTYDIADPQYDADKETVEDLCAIEEGLSDWEVTFVESVSRRVLEEHNTLTDGQQLKAAEILERF